MTREEIRDHEDYHTHQRSRGKTVSFSVSKGRAFSLVSLCWKDPIRASGVELPCETLGAPPTLNIEVQLLSGKALEVGLLSQWVLKTGHRTKEVFLSLKI